MGAGSSVGTGPSSKAIDKIAKSEKAIDKLFKKIDANNDSMLSIIEMYEWMCAVRPAARAAVLSANPPSTAHAAGATTASSSASN